MHIRGATRFKLEFVCIRLTLANLQSMRAVVISVAEIGSSTHIMGALALENGTVQQMPIRRDLFLAAQSRGDVVTLEESDSMGGRFTLFGPNGRSLTLGDTEGGRKVG